MLCKFFVDLIEEIVILMVWFCLENVGRLVVMIMVVMFLVFGLVLGGNWMLKFCSMVLKFWLVKGVDLLVFGKLVIKLYLINWLLWMFVICVIFLICVVCVLEVSSNINKIVNFFMVDVFYFLK